jgi:hypothetical protein
MPAGGSQKCEDSIAGNGPRAAYSIGAGRRFARGSIGIRGRYPSWSRRRVR